MGKFGIQLPGGAIGDGGGASCASPRPKMGQIGFFWPLGGSKKPRASPRSTERSSRHHQSHRNSDRKGFVHLPAPFRGETSRRTATGPPQSTCQRVVRASRAVATTSSKAMERSPGSTFRQLNCEGIGPIGCSIGPIGARRRTVVMRRAPSAITRNRRFASPCALERTLYTSAYTKRKLFSR